VLLGGVVARGEEATVEPKSEGVTRQIGEELRPALAPGAIRFHLADGSVITGEVAIPELSLETEFGTLKIPMDRVRSFTPGLNSRSQLSQRIHSLIKDLGADDDQLRTRARQGIVKMGLAVRKELGYFRDDENAERRQRVREIEKDLEELNEELGGDEEKRAATLVWIRPDTVVTTDFTVLGKISPDRFTIRTHYGEATIALDDLVQADRGTDTKTVVNKRIIVSGENLAQRGFLNSNVHVRRGDRITIRADGRIRMTRWGSGDLFSTPDGKELFNWYVQNEIPGGTLIAKIGVNGNQFKVGSRHDSVAEVSGTLRFAVAVQEAFSGDGNHYPGLYQVWIRVVRN
jgi:hypothetical protein